MLPRTAKLDREFEDALRSYVQARSRSSPILSQIRSHVVHEGVANVIERTATDSEQTKMMQASAETKMAFNEIENVDVNYILGKANEIAAQFEEHFSRNLFKTMEEVTTKTGQTMNAGGKPLTNEVMMEMFSKMQINFENSSHGGLTIVTAPDAVPTFEKLERERKENPEIQKKWDALMERKRNEFREREINRNLVG